MKAFTVHDNGIGLLDFLTLDSGLVGDSKWDCHHVEVLGPAGQDLNMSGQPNDRRSLAGHELLRLAASVEQVLDGDFSGHLASSRKPWLTIRSIRGMYFVVTTNSDALVAALKQRFQDVRESSDDGGYVA